MTSSVGLSGTNSLVARSQSERIGQLLQLGCKTLDMVQGVLLRITHDYAEVIVRACDTKAPQLALIPDFPHVDAAAVPQSHLDATDGFKRWAHLYLGAEQFVRGRLHTCAGHSLVLFFMAPIHVDISKIDNTKLELIDGWLESLLFHDEHSDSIRNHALYEKLQSVANIGTWEVDLVNEAISWSSQTKVIHEVDEDYTPDMATALCFYKAGYDRDEIARIMEHTINTGDPWTTTLQLVTAKGNHVWVECHGMAEMIDGICVRLFGTFQDVSKSMELRLALDKQREDAVQAYNARGELLSRISHELRTPLNGITGMIQAMRYEKRERIREKKADLALRSANKLLQLINDVLDYTEISNGHFSLNHSDFCIRALVEDIIDVFKPLCDEKGIRLYIALDFPENTYLNGDAARIGQVIDNLISNAVKFTQQGHISVQLALDKNNARLDLQIAVEDTGEGMSADTVKSLFTPLIHGDKTSPTKNSGSGLGLTIVKQIVDKMEGEITVKTDMGKGTVFEAKLPVDYASQAEGALDDPECISQRLLRLPLALLVVDDNDINRMVLKSMLDQHNYSADEAEDGQVALEKARKRQYDVIFMDCAMPVLDGIAASKLIISKGYLPAHGKIVAVTANTTEEDKAACKHAGMAEFLSKPVDYNAVTAILKDALLNKELVVQQW